MILFKKSHAEQLLHLALALSLLRANPANYRASSWHNRRSLATHHGGGIQMEMQTLPLHDNLYATRKAALPIIEDLIHIQRFPSYLSHDIQTYLLNIQNEHGGAAAVAGVTESGDETPAPVALDPPQNHSAALTELDLFLHPDHFADTASLMDLNLADLRDYGDDLIIPPSSASMPLKDEVPDVFGTGPFSFLYGGDDDEAAAAAAAPGTSYTSGLGSLFGANNQSDDEVATGERAGRVINWAEYHAVDEELTLVKLEADVKVEPVAEELQSEPVHEETVPEIKTEEDVKSEDESSESSNSSGFVSTVELTQEVNYNLV